MRSELLGAFVLLVSALPLSQRTALCGKPPYPATFGSPVRAGRNILIAPGGHKKYATAFFLAGTDLWGFVAKSGSPDSLVPVDSFHYEDVGETYIRVSDRLFDLKGRDTLVLFRGVPGDSATSFGCVRRDGDFYRLQPFPVVRVRIPPEVPQRP